MHECTRLRTHWFTLPAPLGSGRGGSELRVGSLGVGWESWSPGPGLGAGSPGVERGRAALACRATATRTVRPHAAAIHLTRSTAHRHGRSWRGRQLQSTEGRGGPGWSLAELPGTAWGPVHLERRGHGRWGPLSVLSSWAQSLSGLLWGQVSWATVGPGASSAVALSEHTPAAWAVLLVHVCVGPVGACEVTCGCEGERAVCRVPGPSRRHVQVARAPPLEGAWTPELGGARVQSRPLQWGCLLQQLGLPGPSCPAPLTL